MVLHGQEARLFLAYFTMARLGTTAIPYSKEERLTSVQHNVLFIRQWPRTAFSTKVGPYVGHHEWGTGDGCIFTQRAERRRKDYPETHFWRIVSKEKEGL